MSRRAPAKLPRRSLCPIACTLDLVGDRWTLLVVRDLLFAGPRRFGELLASPERIPTNLLSDRLRRLERLCLVRRTAYQRHPRRYLYELTERGADLAPVLVEMMRWANRNVPGTFVAPPEMLARIAGRRAPAEEDAR